jgi:hypothetical protein
MMDADAMSTPQIRPSPGDSRTICQEPNLQSMIKHGLCVYHFNSVIETNGVIEYTIVHVGLGYVHVRVLRSKLPTCIRMFPHIERYISRETCY